MGTAARFLKEAEYVAQFITCGDAKAQALAAVAQATVGGDWKRAKRLDGAEHAARSVRRDRIPLQNRNI